MWIFGPFWVRVTLSLIFPPCIVSNGTDVQHWVGLSNLTICITLWRHTGITFRRYCKEKHSVSSLIHLFCIWSWLFTKLVIPVRKKSVSKSGRALCLQIKCKILWHPHSFRCPVKARPWSDVSQEAGHCPFASLRGAGEWKQPIHLTLFCKFIFHIWCHQSNSNKDNWWLPSLMQQIQFQFRFIQGSKK